jgi:predicted acylesterase/phospholipase RssA
MTKGTISTNTGSNQSKHSFSYTNIVIAGGSMKSLSSIGSIAYLEEVNLIQHIKNFVGTSAGSLVCLFMVLGYTAQEIVKFLMENIQKEEIASLNIDDLFGILENYGLNLGKNLERFVSLMIYTKMKVKDATFIDLAKFSGNNLVVCVANLTKETDEYWSVDTTPNMSVIKAIRTSCSLPILFTPMQHNGDLYIDGGIYNNFPIDYFAKTNSLNSSFRDIIGINIVSSTPKCTDTFINYISLIFHTVIKRLTKEYKDDISKNILTLEFEDEGWISLSNLRIDISKDILERYISTGYQKMKKLLQGYETLHKKKLQYDDRNIEDYTEH